MTIPTFFNPQEIFINMLEWWVVDNTVWSKSLCVPDDYNTESQVHRDFLITVYKYLRNKTVHFAGWLV